MKKTMVFSLANHQLKKTVVGSPSVNALKTFLQSCKEQEIGKHNLNPRLVVLT